MGKRMDQHFDRNRSLPAVRDFEASITFGYSPPNSHSLGMNRKEHQTNRGSRSPIPTMYLECPDHIPKLPEEIPDTVPIHEFIFEEKYGRHPKSSSKPLMVCGLTGKSQSVFEVEERFQLLARALSVELGWHVNEGNELDKVIGICSPNTVESH